MCEGCGEPLPAFSRAGRRFHGSTCRSRGLRRRRREEAARALAGDPVAAALSEALAAATREERLLGLIAQEAPRSWRAAAYLLERLHPRDGQGARAAEPHADELAAIRAR